MKKTSLRLEIAYKEFLIRQCNIHRNRKYISSSSWILRNGNIFERKWRHESKENYFDICGFEKIRG